MRKWLPFLIILGFPVIPLGWIVLSRQRGVDQLFSPGALARGHDGLACKDCHAESWRTGKNLWQAEAGPTMDQACAHCHGGLPGSKARAGAGVQLLVFSPMVGPHNDKQLPDAIGTCADCHKDHQGDKHLLHVPDSRCTRCHADLRASGGSSSYHPRITSFERDHPPFGQRPTAQRDPGALRFNHQVHLNIRPESVHGIVGPLARLQKLGCGACHQEDPAGRYMLPIRYATHCASCHPLTVALASRASAEASLAVDAFGREPAPHLPPEAIRTALRHRLSVLALQFPQVLQEKPAVNRPLPGRPRPRPVTWTPLAWVDHQAAVLDRQLHDGAGGCRYCHLPKEPARQDGGLPKYEATKLPERWFSQARFSHARHRLMRCQDCHPAETSSTTADVLMPGIDQCRQCHHSKARLRPARSDCLECHRYHGPSAP